MIALQVRGGPEPYMISSWIQILRVRSTDAGVYSCTVVSKKGIVRAEATVQVAKVNFDQIYQFKTPKKPPLLCLGISNVRLFIFFLSSNVIKM